MTALAASGAARVPRPVGGRHAALPVAACLLLAGCESFLASRAEAEFPAPGRLVPLADGRRLHLDCRGEGSPTALLISGGDTLGALAWGPVMQRSAGVTRVCAFSRAGLMWSDPATGEFTPEEPAEDLRAALRAAGEEGPFVLVAHSRGGLYALIFAALFPEETAGLVLADSSHPDQEEAFRAAGLRTSVGPGPAGRLALALSWTGLLRLSPPAREPSVAPAANAFYPRSAAANARELSGRGATLAMAGRFRDLRNWPLVVLAREAPEQSLARRELDARNAYLLPGDAMGEDMAGASPMEAVWRRLQADLSTWSSRGRLEIVPDANHAFFFHRPDVVVRAIREVVTAARVVQRPAPAPD